VSFKDENKRKLEEAENKYEAEAKIRKEKEQEIKKY